jgi:predicted choloylglycine hydrolase
MDSSPLTSIEYGKKMGKNYFATYQFINQLFTIFYPRAEKNQESRVQNQIDIMEKYCHSFLEELQGVSFSTRIPIERLVLLQSLLSYHYSHRHCTITGATSPATRNNQSYLTQNWDIFAFSPLVPLTRFFTYFPHINTDESGYRYVYLGIPVLYEIPLMNEKGLGFAGAGLTLTKNASREIDTGDGVPIYYLELMTMKNCSTVAEVVDLWRSTPRSSDPSLLYPHYCDYDITMWGDHQGDIVLLEETHHYFIAVYQNSTEMTHAPPGILWHANHHIWLNPNLTGSSFPDETTSGTRTTRAEELLETYYGNITLNECMNITRDHGGGTDPTKEDSSDICSRPDKNGYRATAFSWIIIPKEDTILWTHARPCQPLRGKYQVHTYSWDL